MKSASGAFTPTTGKGSVDDYSVRYMAFKVTGIDYGTYVHPPFFGGWSPSAANFVDVSKGLVQPGPAGGLMHTGNEFYINHRSLYEQYKRNGNFNPDLVDAAGPNNQWYNYFFLMYNLEIHGEFVDVTNDGANPDGTGGSAYDYGTVLEEDNGWAEVRLLKPLTKKEADALSD